MIEDKAGRCFLDGQVVAKCIDGFHARCFFLISHLSMNLDLKIILRFAFHF